MMRTKKVSAIYSNQFLTTITAMKKIDQAVKNAQIIVQFMKDDLNFEISQQDVSIGKIEGSAGSIHIKLDIKRQVFFKPFFDNLRNNYLHLLRDNKKQESVKLIKHVKSDLANLLHEQVLPNEGKNIHFHFVNL